MRLSRSPLCRFPGAARAALVLTGLTPVCRAELNEWKTIVADNAASSQLVYSLSRMVTAAEPAVLPAVTGDRTYEFICHITRANTATKSVALAGNGSFCYKLHQWGQTYYAPGSTRYGVSDDVYTPLSLEATRVYLTTTHVHFVVQADGTGLLYLDGTLRGTMAAGTQPVLSGNVMLGAGGPDRRDAMGNGAIIACAVYDRALTSSEVAARADAWKVEYSGPAGLATEIRRDRPAHWWRFSEQFTTQAVADSGMGTPHPGTFAGGCTPGQTGPHVSAGSAVRVAGIEYSDPGRVEIPDLPQYRNYTLEAWFYLDADADSVYFPILTHSNQEAFNALAFIPSSGRVSGNISVLGSASAEELGPPRAARGRWHHVAITNSGSMTVYVDGLPTYSQTAGLDDDIDNGTTSGILVVGSVLGGLFPLGFKGMIDEVAVYPYALSGFRIQDHYTAAGGRLPLAQAGTQGSSQPFDETAWQAVPAPVDYDVGRLAAITVAPGSGLQRDPDSAPLSALNDGQLGDDGLDAPSSPGPNGRADGFRFADGAASGRLLMTFPEPVSVGIIRVWGGADRLLYGTRAHVAGSVWMGTGTGALPATPEDLEGNPAWRRFGVMWTPSLSQNSVEMVAPHGMVGPVKYLLFEFDTAGDGQSDIIREIDVRGGPAVSQPDLRIEKLSGNKVRLHWRAEYENWFPAQYIDDPRYRWTGSFLNLPAVQGLRGYIDYTIPADGVWPYTSRRSLFRMSRVEPVEAP